MDSQAHLQTLDTAAEIVMSWNLFNGGADQACVRPPPARPVLPLQTAPLLPSSPPAKK